MSYIHQSPHSMHYLANLTCSLLISAPNLSTPNSFFSSLVFGFLLLSHECCRHCAAVGRFSGAKSRMGPRKSANSRASKSENLYFSTRSLSSDQNFSLLILLRSPCLSNKSFDRDPPTAICTQNTTKRILVLGNCGRDRVGMWSALSSHLPRYFSKEFHHESQVILKPIH